MICDKVGQKLKFLCKLIDFEAHEGAELTIKMYCLVIIAIQSINNTSYCGIKYFPRTTDCFESTHNDLNVKCREIKVHVPFIFNSQR